MSCVIPGPMAEQLAAQRLELQQLEEDGGRNAECGRQEPDDAAIVALLWEIDEALTGRIEAAELDDDERHPLNAIRERVRKMAEAIEGDEPTNPAHADLAELDRLAAEADGRPVREAPYLVARVVPDSRAAACYDVCGLPERSTIGVHVYGVQNASIYGLPDHPPHLLVSANVHAFRELSSVAEGPAAWAETILPALEEFCRVVRASSAVGTRIEQAEPGNQ